MLMEPVSDLKLLDWGLFCQTHHTMHMDAVSINASTHAAILEILQCDVQSSCGIAEACLQPHCIPKCAVDMYQHMAWEVLWA